MVAAGALLGSWVTKWLIILSLAITSLCLLCGHRFRYWRNRGVPYLSPTFPFGNLRRCFLGKMSMGMNIAEIYTKMKGYRFVGIYAVLRPVLVVIDPTLVQRVLVKDFNAFQDRGVNLDETMPLHRQLFCLTGHNWKRLRIKLTPMFASGKLEMMFPMMQTCAQDLCHVMEAKATSREVTEMHDLVKRFTTDVIASVAFGVQANSLRNPHSEFKHWMDRLFMSSFTRMIMIVAVFLSPTLLKILKLKSEERSASEYFTKMAKYTVNYRESNRITKNDYLQMLVQLRNAGTLEDEKGRSGAEDTGAIRWKLPLDDVAAQAFMFLLAGFGTCSGTLCFALHELAVNRDVQTKLQKELDSAHHLTYDAIVHMSYLDQVVSETLRKYPVIPVLNRKSCVDYKIPGTDVTIQKGTPVMISVYGLHHDPVFYPDPEHFDPERFSQQRKAEAHPSIYLPFGDGPRNCIGKTFALLLVKVGLVHILSKFNVDICDKIESNLQFYLKSFILAPDGGVHLRLSKRRS